LLSDFDPKLVTAFATSPQQHDVAGDRQRPRYYLLTLSVSQCPFIPQTLNL